MSETVFVLGAGFSKPAKIPVQEEIMQSISNKIAREPYYRNVQDLYFKLFHLSDVKQMEKIPLEDIFTFLDRSISGREDTNDLHLEEILKRQASLRRLVAMILNEKLKTFATEKDFEEKRHVYEFFFNELIVKRKQDLKQDPFSIASLNWDTIPEFFIDNICKDNGYNDTRIDYTCYDYDYADDINNPKHIPSIHLKRLNKYNIKIQKLHGSLNWGYCSSCGRLYVRYSHKTPPVFFEGVDRKCKCCEQTQLKRLIITPTLIKDLNNTHLKMIWHNAMMDIQEAKRIVFIGYSFPLADFEFRYILIKAIASSSTPEKKKIRVILFPPDKLLKKIPLEDRERLKWERNAQEKRYRNFFGHLDFDVKFMDALDFMKDASLIWKW